MFVQQTQYTIEKIVNRIRGGRLALPEFQRDFVWSPNQVADLLESISREWPIGSLLLLNGPQPFAFRAIDSAPEVFHPDLDLYVLDGQQRVTAIYHAIQDVSQFVYYVDFKDAVPDRDEVIVWERRRKFEQRFPTLESRADACVALVKDFWKNESFHEWLDLIPESSRRNEFVMFRERRLGGLQSKVYFLLAIELEQGIELEALAKIFETLNKTGVRLNAFDLLVAKLYPTQFNLRDEWDGARSRNDIISQFDPDGLEVVKLVSLLVRNREGKQHSRGVRQGDVLSLNSELVKKYWHEALELYVQALNYARKFGVVSSSSVPNWSMILGLAGQLSVNAPHDQIRVWWLSRLRNQTFGQAANTRIVAEFDALTQRDMATEDMAAKDFDEMVMLPARANGLLLRGISAMVALNGAKDPITGEPLMDARKVEFLEVTDDGVLRKLSQTTDFQRVVFASDEGAKRLKTGTTVGNIDGCLSLLELQGFDPATFRRSGKFLEGLLQ